MIVRTSRTISRPIDELWLSLCDSRMRLPHRSPLFRLGIPKPVECRLPDGPDGVGARRECISVIGVVQQEITHLIQRHVCQAISEQFDLEDVGCGMTRITRTTEVTMRPGVRRCAAIFVRLGLMTIHRYVFANWAITSESEQS